MDQKLYRDFVYFDDQRYPSYEGLKYAGFGIFPFLSLIITTVGIVTKIIPFIVVILLIDVLYVAFLYIIRRNNIKKTYSFRFFVNGISSVFLSVLCLLLCFIPVIAINHNVVALILTGIFSCVLFVFLSCIAIWICIKKGVFGKAIKSQKLKIASAVSAALLPASGMIGRSIAKTMRSAFDFNNETWGYIVFFIFEFAMLISSLGVALSFMKYHYCRKFAITCDENGDTTSPGLEPPPKVKKNWKSRPIFKVLIVLASIVGAIVGIIIVIFLVALIKAIVSSIGN